MKKKPSKPVAEHPCTYCGRRACSLPDTFCSSECWRKYHKVKLSNPKPKPKRKPEGLEKW